MNTRILIVTFLVYSTILSVEPQTNECVFVDTTTGEYKLDLSELIGVEQSYFDGWYNYTYYPCSNQFYCENHIGFPNAVASLNQLEPLSEYDDCWWLAVWDNGATQPSYNPTSQIWSFTYFGSYGNCDNPRKTTVNWHCNPDIDGYIITNASETNFTQCVYQVDIDSYYACVDAPPPYCQWYGNDGSGNVVFDLTPLSGTTIIGNDRTNTELVFAYTPCRNATQCDDLDVMVKLQNISTADGCKSYLGIWEDEINGGVPEYDNGIWRFGYDNGEPCGELTSELYIYWYCDPNITSYRVDVADVVEPCLYDIYISSSLACV